jgi:hypothetical protein
VSRSLRLDPPSSACSEAVAALERYLAAEVTESAWLDWLEREHVLCMARLRAACDRDKAARVAAERLPLSDTPAAGSTAAYVASQRADATPLSPPLAATPTTRKPRSKP